MKYEILFANGDRSIEVEGWLNVAPSLRAKYGYDVVLGHDFDLSEGGDCTFFWSNQEDAEEDHQGITFRGNALDGGSRALGEVRRVVSE